MRLSKETIKNIKKMVFQEGYSRKSVADFFDIAPSTVTRYTSGYSKNNLKDTKKEKVQEGR